MEKDRMALLLEKYWRAETTTEEEKLIKQWFCSRGPSELADDDYWFKAIKDFQGIESSVVHFTVTKPVTKTKLLNLGAVLKIAASIVLALGVIFGSIAYHNRKIQAENDLAVKQNAEASLLFISKVINQANNDLDKSAECISMFKKSKR